MTASERIAEWACSLTLADIPESVLAKARLQAVSVLGATYAGALYERAPQLSEAIHAWPGAGTGRALLFPEAAHAPIEHALYLNSALACAHDYDDYLFLAHTGHSALHAPLAHALAHGGTWGDVLLGIVINNELGGRIAASVQAGPQNGQLWTFCHLLGTIGALGRLRGLTPKELVHAIGIGFYQPPAALWPGFVGGDAKLFSASTPALLALHALDLAEAGLHGANDILDHPQGFVSRFSYIPLPRLLTGFGRSWVTETVAFKRMPGCAYIDTAMDAFDEIAAEREAAGKPPLRPADVAAVDVDASLLSSEMENLFANRNRYELTPIGVNFSIRLSLALRILHGRLDVEDLTTESLRHNNDAIRDLESRIGLHHDWRMTLGFLESFLASWNALAAVRHVRLRDWMQARKRGQRDFDSSALGPRDIPELLRAIPADARKRLLKALRPRLGGGAPRRGYDLGDVDFSRVLLPFSARVRLRETDGQTWESTVEIPRGAQGRPPAEIRTDTRDKLIREAGRHLGPSRAARIADWMLDAEPNTPIDQFSQLVAP